MGLCLGSGSGSGSGSTFYNVLFCYFHVFLLFSLLCFFFMILPNANNQRLRRNRELHAEHHGVVFNRFSR